MPLPPLHKYEEKERKAQVMPSPPLPENNKCTYAVDDSRDNVL